MLQSDARPFLALQHHEHLDALIASSSQAPVVMFKHSPTCGTSAHAYDELASYLADADAVEIYLIDVIDSRPMSQAVAARFGIRHESPQVLVVVDGQVRWSASHYGVTAERLRRALVQAGSPKATEAALPPVTA